MKAEELMIGDWVEYGQYVTTVRHLSDVIVLSGCVGRLEEVRPIPLTSDILTKNGFKYDEFPKFAVNKITEKTKVMFSYHSGSRTVFMGISEPNFNLTSACVLYVHELQHALKLCRIMEEIKL